MSTSNWSQKSQKYSPETAEQYCTLIQDNFREMHTSLHSSTPDTWEEDWHLINVRGLHDHLKAIG